jgi:hypothetical protein
MNSTARGDEFEDMVFTKLREALEKGELGLIPECCKMFRKKGYHSPDRGGPIEFDISIELFRPGAEKPSLLWLWECKDYSGTVPVGDVEEFWAKVQQVAGLNVKAGFAARGELSSGAMSIAHSRRMAVVQIQTRNVPEIEWRFDFSRFSNNVQPPRLRPVQVITFHIASDDYDSWESFVRALISWT